MLSVEIDIFVNAPPERVFQFISNFENNPKWQKGMDECVYITPPPMAIGSQYEQKAHFLGKPIYSTFEVIEYEENKRVKATTIKSSFPITFTRMVELKDGGARVRAIIEGDATGFFRLAKPLLKWMMSSSIKKDYKRLKKMMESETHTYA